MEGEQSQQNETHGSARRLSGILREFTKATVRRIGGLAGKIRPHGLITVLILFLVILILLETVRERNVSFAPILVPEELVGIGYTPRVVSQRIIDRVDLVFDESIRSMSYAEKKAVERMPIVHSQPTIDLALPTLDISINSVAAYLRNLVKLNEHYVTGEILYHKTNKLVSLRLRLDGLKIFEASREFSDADMDELFDLGADEIIKRIEPFVLARFHYSEEEKVKARDVITFIHRNPEVSKHYIEAIVLEGVILSEEERFDDSFRAFRMATEIDPKYVSAFVNWGNALVKANDHDAAIEKFDKAIGIDPKYKQAYLSWGLSLKKQGKLDGAIAKYKQAIEFDPDYASAYVNWGNALADNKKFAKAIKKYKKALQIAPDHGIAYMNWGITLQDRGCLSGAIEKYWRAVRMDPNFVRGYVAWGAALAKKGDTEGAIEQYRKAAQIDPKYAPTYDHWGLALLARKDYSAAIDQFKEAIEYDPKLATAYVNLGIVLAAQDKFPEAEEKYQEAVKLEPSFAPAFYNWGVLLARQGDCERAAKKYERANEIDSNLTPPICESSDEGPLPEKIGAIGDGISEDSKQEEWVSDEDQTLPAAPTVAVVRQQESGISVAG